MTTHTRFIIIMIEEQSIVLGIMTTNYIVLDRTRAQPMGINCTESRASCWSVMPAGKITASCYLGLYCVMLC